MIAEEPSNLLPLDTWRRTFGVNPWHFWGLASNSGAAQLDSQCLTIVTEYAWQNVQALGRDDMRSAIIQSEAMLREWSGYWPAPVYGETTVKYPTRGNNYMAQGRMQPNWRQIGVNLQEAKLIRLGIQQRTIIDLSATIDYQEPDDDGLFENFEITLAGIDPTLTTDQVAVYFTEADRLDEADISERWRILPLTVKITGTTLTIKGKSWLLVRPEAYENMTLEGLDATDPDNFVTEVSVYRRVTDPNGITVDTSQAMLTWENRPCHGWWCCCGVCNALNPSSDPAATATAIARAGIRYPETGIVYATQSAYSTDTGFWTNGINWWEPDQITVRWLAGVPLGKNNIMQRDWAMITARLAAAEMGRPICACESANKELYTWQFDLATQTSEAEQYQLGQDDLNNPIGTRRGHVEAWKWVSRKEAVEGFLPG